MLALYCAFEGNDVHLHVSKFIGVHGATFDSFIQEAKLEAEKHGVTLKHVMDADKERKSDLTQALKTAGVYQKIVSQNKELDRQRLQEVRKLIIGEP